MDKIYRKVLVNLNESNIRETFLINIMCMGDSLKAGAAVTEIELSCLVRSGMVSVVFPS